MAKRPKFDAPMYHRTAQQRAARSPDPMSVTDRYGFRSREWAGQSLGTILTAYREAYGKSVQDEAQALC